MDANFQVGSSGHPFIASNFFFLRTIELIVTAVVSRQKGTAVTPFPSADYPSIRQPLRNPSALKSKTFY
jgi:hypothetical protein